MILNIYTDASTLTHLNNASGIGVVVTFDNEIYKTIGQHVGELSIGDAELFAMVVALKEAKEIIPLMEQIKSHLLESFLTACQPWISPWVTVSPVTT